MRIPRRVHFKPGDYHFTDTGTVVASDQTLDGEREYGIEPDGFDGLVVWRRESEVEGE